MTRIEIRSDVTGVVAKVDASPGDQIHVGDQVAVMESMKMEIPQLAGSEGTVIEVLHDVGDAVEEGAVLVVIDSP